MGLNKTRLTPCGFCFVEYHTHEDAVAARKFVSGTKLDEKIIRADLDCGFEEGRQFGRSKKSGGQIRNDPSGLAFFHSLCFHETRAIKAPKVQKQKARDGVERKKMELDPNFLMQHLLNLILFQKDLLPPRLPMSILHLIFLLLRLLLLTLLLLPLRFLKKRICR
jgi:RNA recognition motif-containing protein